MTDLLQHVEQNIQNRGLFKRGGKILVAVSGGLDSMTLLQALKKLSGKYRWQLIVGHFNHRLRGRASDTDERLVRKTAAAMKLRVAAGSADVKAFAVKSKLSLEMAARELRHEFFARVASERKIKTIALAHHAGDQVELFFLRLLRGAGGEGLAGMKWRSPSPADKTISLVRPLLDSSKSELAEFARENKIRFRDDATNCSPDFLRNRIRNELLPLLRKNYQPGLDKAVLRLMEIVGVESEFAGEAAQSVVSSLRLGKVRPKAERYIFDDLPIAIQRRVLQQQLADVGVVSDFDLIESLRQAADCFISIGPNRTVARNATGRVALCAGQTSRFNDEQLLVELDMAEQVVFDSMRFDWQIQSPGKRLLPRRKSGREFFDADKIGDKIVLRHWRPGDRFNPIGLSSPVKLQDLFTNAKIPRGWRRKLILAEAPGGGIFWVEGLRIGEKFKLTPRTKRRLAWNWSRQLP